MSWSRVRAVLAYLILVAAIPAMFAVAVGASNAFIRSSPAPPGGMTAVTIWLLVLPPAIAIGSLMTWVASKLLNK